MAKAWPEKKRAKKNEADGQPALPGVHRAAQVGDRLTEETGEYEVIGQASTTNAGKRRARAGQANRDNAEVTMNSLVGRA
jgi:hypothetical protein